MSTKIYQAWRVPRRSLDEAIPLANDTMLAMVISFIRKVARSLKDEVIREHYATINPAIATARRIPFDVKVRYVDTFWRNINAKGVWDELECGWRIWVDQRHVYFIPYGSGIVLNTLKMPKPFEEYAYWNNTDRPKNITQRRWDARRRTWDRVAFNGDNWSRVRLDNTVMSASAIHQQTRVMEALGASWDQAREKHHRRMKRSKS